MTKQSAGEDGQAGTDGVRVCARERVEIVKFLELF